MYGHAYRVGIDKVPTTLKDGGQKNHTLLTHPLPHVLFFFYRFISLKTLSLSLSWLAANRKLSLVKEKCVAKRIRSIMGWQRAVLLSRSKTLFLPYIFWKSFLFVSSLSFYSFPRSNICLFFSFFFSSGKTTEEDMHDIITTHGL